MKKKKSNKNNSKAKQNTLLSIHSHLNRARQGIIEISRELIGSIAIFYL